MDLKILYKKIDGTLTPSESKDFEDWHQASDENRRYFEQLKNNTLLKPEQIDVETSWAHLSKQIEQPKNFRWIYTAAACIAILLASSLFLFNGSNDIGNDELTIQIGTDRAELILEDGSIVDLLKNETIASDYFDTNNGQLIYKAGPLTPTDPKINYLSVPSGGQYMVQLSDSTKVWLNSNSKLKYPIQFIEGETRVVELIYGEAFFEVSPSSKHQGSGFHVKTKDQTIEVLGTQFNVKAYENESKITTTLVEGKIAIKTPQHEDTLLPGDQSVHNLNTQEFTKSFVSQTKYDVAWKNGYFMFKNEPLENIMNTLSRWYDIEVKFKNKGQKDILFSGNLNRQKHIRTLLNDFAKTGEVKFEIKNRIVYIQ